MHLLLFSLMQQPCTAFLLHPFLRQPYFLLTQQFSLCLFLILEAFFFLATLTELWEKPRGYANGQGRARQGRAGEGGRQGFRFHILLSNLTSKLSPPPRQTRLNNTYNGVYLSKKAVPCLSFGMCRVTHQINKIHRWSLRFNSLRVVVYDS